MSIFMQNLLLGLCNGVAVCSLQTRKRILKHHFHKSHVFSDFFSIFSEPWKCSKTVSLCCVILLQQTKLTFIIIRPDIWRLIKLSLKIIYKNVTNSITSHCLDGSYLPCRITKLTYNLMWIKTTFPHRPGYFTNKQPLNWPQQSLHSRHFMKPHVSLLCLQRTVACPYPM